MQLNMWPAGEEIFVAGAMMNIFSILPWNAPIVTESGAQQMTHIFNDDNTNQSNQMHLIPFIRRYVEILVKLNRVLCQYRSYSSILSPYVLPLSKFISTYPQEWLLFFIDPLTLSKNEVS